MSVLICETTGAVYTLRLQTEIGRSRICQVRLNDPHVSGEHARLCWRHGRWEILDLGSRNGTWIQSRRLETWSGEVIDTTARFHFGAPGDDWRLLDGGPPVPKARALDDGALRASRDGIIRLPDDDAPELLIYRDGTGRWLLEQVGDAREVSDLETLTVSGRAWQLHLPKDGAPEASG